jgi:hypothetical protein
VLRTAAIFRENEEHTMAGEMQAVTKMYDVLKWLLPKISKLPRSHKFTLGDRATNLALDVLMLLVEATYTREKLDLLLQAIASRHYVCESVT